MSERLERIVSENKNRLLSLPFVGALQTPGASVNLFTDLDEIRVGIGEQLNSLSGAVPGWKVRLERESESYSIFLLKNNEKAFLYDRETKAVFLLGDKEDFIDGQVLGWISYWMMEAQRQEKSLFTLHSSALAIDGKGILLLGHSGAGKTSVMLDLCKKHNAEVVSNDLTIVGHDSSSRQMELVEGTKEIRLRLTSVEKNFPDLAKLFVATGISAWESKIVVVPEQVGLRSSSGPRCLAAIFEIHLDSKEKDPLVVREEKEIPIYYRLYEDMSRIVRGSAISVFGSDASFLGYMPSLDTENMHANRVNCINQMVRGTGIISVSGGGLDEISEAIFQIISKN